MLIAPALESPLGKRPWNASFILEDKVFLQWPATQTSSVNPRQFMNRKKKTMSLTIYNFIIAASAPLRRIIHIVAVALIFIFPPIALAQCAGISEEGRW